ncbi:hypothetical protein RIF29_33370 [Crotalaria pallida]|uniref:Uncharacterized protein n=1 Tax=Crotalaria pallida TaxID=3830 RepID=A0AAN9EDL3_CROPI
MLISVLWDIPNLPRDCTNDFQYYTKAFKYVNVDSTSCDDMELPVLLNDIYQNFILLALLYTAAVLHYVSASLNYK